MAEIDEKELTADRETDLPIPDILPVLPLKDVVVFPFIILPLSVSREKSINAVDAALADQRIIMLVAQKDGQNETPGPADLHGVGTVAGIMRMIKLPDGRIRILVQGLARARIDSVQSRSRSCGHDHAARGDGAAHGPSSELEAFLRSVKQPREVGRAGQVRLAGGHADRHLPGGPGTSRGPGGLEPDAQAGRGAEGPRVHGPEGAAARWSTRASRTRSPS